MTKPLETQPSPASNRLAQVLRLRDAVAIVIGGIIGSGIFVAPSIVARDVGAPGLSLVVWVLAGAVALSGALCYAELAAMIPETGGVYTYLKRAFRSPMVAFFFGWTFFLVDGPGSIAAVANVFASYASVFLQQVMPVTSTTQKALAVMSILVLTAANYRGVRSGAAVQNLFTTLKLSALLAVIGIGLISGNGSWSHFTPFVPAKATSSSGTVSTIMLGLMPALFTYGGWSYSTYVSGEIKNPERNVPRSIFIGLAVVIAVYLLANVTYMYVLPFDVLAASTRVASDSMEAAVGQIGALFLAAAVMVSTFGATNAVILIYARIGYAMSRAESALEPLGRVHKRFKSPFVALIVQGVISSAFAVSGSYEQILSYFSFVEYFFFSLGVLAVIMLRYKEPDTQRPYRVVGYPLTPVLFLSVSVVYLVSLLFQRFAGSMVGIVLMLSGLPLYVWGMKKRATDEAQR